MSMHFRFPEADFSIAAPSAGPSTHASDLHDVQIKRAVERLILAAYAALFCLVCNIALMGVTAPPESRIQVDRPAAWSYAPAFLGGATT
jgi:hypothetical protein